MSRPHRTRHFEIEASLPCAAAPPEVIAHTREPQTWPSWQSEIVSVEGPRVLREGDVVDGDARLLGFDVTGRSTTLVATEDRYEQDVIVGVRMRVSYRVAPTPSGSIISHRMAADLPTGVAGNLLSLLLAWRLKKMQRSLLASLSRQAAGRQAEAGPS